MFGLFEKKDPVKQQKFKLAEDYAKQKMKELGFIGALKSAGWLKSIGYPLVLIAVGLMIIASAGQGNASHGLENFLAVFIGVLLFGWKDITDKAFFKFYNDKKKELGI